MTTDRTPRRPGRSVLVIALAAAAVILGTAAYVYLYAPSAPPSLSVEVATTAPPPTTAPTMSRPVAADQPTTTTAPTTTTTALPEPTTQPTTTTAPTTTTTALPEPTTQPTTTTAAAAAEEDHDLVDVGTIPSTTFVASPSTPGDGECHGEYVAHHRVREQCVLDRLQEIFDALFGGTHDERMASVRDGHLLADLYTALSEGHRAAHPEWPYTSWDDGVREHIATEVYGAVWNGPDLLGVRVRATDPDGEWIGINWFGIPVVWTDGHWLVSYAGICRHLSRMSDPIRVSCLPDPRPHIAEATGASFKFSGAFDPDDMPLEERLQVSRNWLW